jgi:tetratricopeptide (TPR) repeat protein
MPKRRTQDVVHAVMTDHLIQRRAPEHPLAELQERTDLVNEGYRGGVIPYYPAPWPGTAEDLLYEAVAQVTQQANLKAGLPQLAGEIAKQHPSRPEFYVELGEAWLNAGNPRNAQSAFEQALTRTPRMAIAVLDLAEALTQLKQPERAAKLLEAELLKKDTSDDPLLWYQAGMYEKALALDPDLAAAHNARGEQLAGAGDLERAEAEFRAALRSEPDLPAAQSNLGHVLAARRDLPEAAWYFARAVRRLPNDADAHVNYGATLRGLNRLDEARRELAAALKIRPDFGLAHLSLGDLLATQGDLAGARPHWQEAAKDADAAVRSRAIQRLNQGDRILR